MDATADGRAQCRRYLAAVLAAGEVAAAQALMQDRNIPLEPRADGQSGLRD